VPEDCAFSRPLPSLPRRHAVLVTERKRSGEPPGRCFASRNQQHALAVYVFGCCVRGAVGVAASSLSVLAGSHAGVVSACGIDRSPWIRLTGRAEEVKAIG
jgi:hypothetical protein